MITNTCELCGKDYLGHQCNECAQEYMIVKIVKENNKYIAVDNRTKDNWTEEFQTLKEALEFINRG